MTTNTTSRSDIPSVLQRIVATKKIEVAAAREAQSLEQLQAQVAADNKPRRGFAAALRATSTKENGIGIIAEIKKASPSKGIINHNFSPALFAKQYEQAGASCLSILTDRDYFQGDDSYLIAAANASSLPILRKDFMIDVYQIYQSYLMGADCILLIMACLDDSQVQELHALSIELGMDVLIEVHTAGELERALQLPRSEHNIYGINNRDLNTFDVDLQTTLDLKNTLLQALAIDDALAANPNDHLKRPLIVTESGIHNSDDIRLMLDHDIQHFLIGEQFMKTDHPGQALQSLLAGVAADE
ncbi:indole-3-glycerol phosphate synthase TrpC [Psychrobacter sp. AOP22-C1-22]|uniref:indole-3-glycerol phosphate synthase TrpC n=1 Tax=unclassified Psychrobacter TaxID=196806 RepID=UPI0017880930|nr:MULTISPECIES: indole-3-glycerol phosphate synthase TrpC [unclassified Psychrobacter]MBE0405331.1 indole-3-glycerol phosphate synthase TrpC [Psychrobacter sp. FME6]MBE0445529.1 indole-3-glycerol phosphate synthase TrpC [Psychrobacter sp. FME5]